MRFTDIKIQIVAAFLLILIGVIWSFGLAGLINPDPDNLEIYWSGIPLLYLDVGVHGILGVFNLIVGVLLVFEISHIRVVGITVCIVDVLVPSVFIWIWSQIPLFGILLMIFQLLADIFFIIIAIVTLILLIIAIKSAKDKVQEAQAYAQMAAGQQYAQPYPLTPQQPYAQPYGQPQPQPYPQQYAQQYPQQYPQQYAQPQPAHYQPQPPPPAVVGTPGCNVCGAPTTFVGHANRWFCSRCNRYI